MVAKRIFKALLFPHLALALILVPLSTVLLILSMAVIGTETAIAYISYILSAYTLTIWCVKIPKLIKHIKALYQKLSTTRLGDHHLRIHLSLYGSLIWNVAYALFQLGLGIYHQSFWFGSIACYYLCLALMRLSLARHMRRHGKRREIRAELIRYRTCGWIFLLMNLALTLMIFFMVYWNRTFHHHEITTITMAAYTFTSLTMAIIGVVRFGKYESPVYSASKAISLAGALVSMLTLESTMLTTFGGETTDLFTRRVLLLSSGIVISLVIIAMAVYMIVKSTTKIKMLKNEVPPSGTST